MDIEEQIKQITESDKGEDIVVAPQDDNGQSDNQPNWTWGRQDTHYKIPAPPQDMSRFFHKSGWDRFWEFIGIGIFMALCNLLIRSC